MAYQVGRMMARTRAVAGLAACVVLAGCVSASLSVSLTDPARYDNYDCKQLDEARGKLVTREGELRDLIDKAQVGTAGPVVAEVAYGSDYASAREELYRVNERRRASHCDDEPRYWGR
jgi:hypothetical protein